MSIAKLLLETFFPSFSLFFLSMTENANCSLCEVVGTEINKSSSALKEFSGRNINNKIIKGSG